MYAGVVGAGFPRYNALDNACSSKSAMMNSLAYLDDQNVPDTRGKTSSMMSKKVGVTGVMPRSCDVHSPSVASAGTYTATYYAACLCQGFCCVLSTHTQAHINSH